MSLNDQIRGHEAASDCCLCLDIGTTNSRVWLVRDGEILYRQAEMVGVRDTARDGNTVRLFSSLAKLIDAVRATAAAMGHVPTEVIGAGMITSALGLLEIPHVPAPAGLAELRAAAVRTHFPAICNLPFVLVPGVATGHPDAEDNDVMRGEEVLCLGLNTEALLSGGGTVLNLGSHWKVISIHKDGRILESYTTIAGELLFAAQANTVLRSSLPPERPEEYPEEWLKRGAHQEREHGLMRASFCVRLLDLAGQGSSEQRAAYLLGAFISNTLRTIERLLQLPLVVTGDPSIAEAWKCLLQESGFGAHTVSGFSLEQAFVRGLLLISYSRPLTQGENV